MLLRGRRVSSDSVATATRNGSTAGPSSSPKATRRARDWGVGQALDVVAPPAAAAGAARRRRGVPPTSRPWVRSTSAPPALATRCVEERRLADARLPEHHHGCRRTRAAPARRARSGGRSRAPGRPARGGRTPPAAAGEASRRNPALWPGRARPRATRVVTSPARRTHGHPRRPAHDARRHHMTTSPRLSQRHIGLLLFDGVEELDAVGPWEVLAYWTLRAPGRRLDGLVPVRGRRGGDRRQGPGPGRPRVVRRRTSPGRADPPRGAGTRRLLRDPAHLDWVRAQRAAVPLMTSVCSGSLVYAAAGLLSGRPATTHWASMNQLSELDPTVITDVARAVRRRRRPHHQRRGQRRHRHGAAPGGPARGGRARP